MKAAGLQQRIQTAIDSLSQVLNQSQKLNFQRWRELDTVVNLELEVRGSYSNEVKFLKSFINIHAGWLNKEFTGFDSTRNYKLTSQQSNEVWDVSGSSTAEGSGLVQNTPSNIKASQKWKLVNLNNGYYKVVNVNSGKATSTNGTLQQETQLIQKTYTAGDISQQWRIVNTGTHYGFINRDSLMAVDNFGSLTSGNNPVTQFRTDIYNRLNQFYSITVASPAVTAPTVQVADTSLAQFSLSPNPATGSNVKVALHLKEDADVKVFLYNAQGLLIRQVSKGNLLKGDTNFALSAVGLRSGYYTVTVMANGKISSQLLLVK